MNTKKYGMGLILAIVVLGMVFAGCTGQTQQTTQTTQPATGTITVTGSTTVLPIAQKAAEAYMAKTPGADIKVSGGGSGVGVQAAGEGTADIGMSSRDVKDSEFQKYTDLKTTVVAGDGIALIVHPTNKVSSLTLDQIKKIYDGNVTNWSQVGGANEKIVVVGRDAASGTREFFWEHVMGKGDFAQGMLEKNSNGAVKTTVALTPGAIGYVGLGYIDAEVKAIKVNKNGTLIEPSVVNVINGTYPISRSLYFLTKGAPKAGLATEFINFLLSVDGQKIVEEEGFVPLVDTGTKPQTAQTATTQTTTQASVSGKITVTGSTTVLPIAQLAAESYMSKNSSADIKVSGGGSGVGVQAAGEGTADIGMSSREVKDSEFQKYPDMKVTVVAGDGIALIVNPSNTVSSLTLAQVKDIYSGKITNWSQVGGTSGGIVVVGRDAASGTREFFWEYVMGKGDFAKGMLEKNSNGAVKQTIVQTPGAIGYVGLGYIDADVKALRIKLDNGTQVAASVSNVINGSYPISRSLYFLTKGEPKGLSKAFTDFILSDEGQKIVEEEGFVPLKK
ncbi:MAG: phosphate ABC transporter substrate-binding protein [Methanofastidiosum sp.]